MQEGMEEQMVKTSVENNLGYIQIHTKGYWDDKLLENSMIVSDLPIQKIKDLKNVTIVDSKLETGMITSYGTQSRGTYILSYDVEKNLPKQVGKNLIDGKLPKDGEREVVLGIDLADYLDAKIGDTLVFLGSGYQGSTAAGLYIISGLLDFHIPELNKSTTYMSLSSLQDLLTTEDRITSLMIDLERPSKLNETATKIKSIVGTNYEVMTWEELTPDLKQLIQTSGAKGYIMNFILYMIISFVMFGTVLMATQERKYEMGVLQAIGFKKRKSMFLVIIENIIISIMGVIIGVIGASPIAYYFNQNPIELAGESAKAMVEMGIEPIIPFSVNPMIAVNHGLIVLVISLILVIYPLLVIKNLNPVSAMKL
jgi:ABC-type lipoprotein release transport system permease subunit